MLGLKSSLTILILDTITHRVRQLSKKTHLFRLIRVGIYRV
jgi:hypothetical protein